MANTDYDRDRYGNQGYQGYGQDWANTGNDRYGEGPYGNWRSGYGYNPGYYGYSNAAYTGNFGTYGYPGGAYNPGGWNQGNQGWNQGNPGWNQGWNRSYTTSGRGQQNWNQTGPFSGVGPQNYQRSDQRIVEDINDRLTQHPFLDASNVNVDVHNGEVTLNGWVNSRHDKRVAEDIADSVMGVKNVTNNLNVQPQHQQQPGWLQSVENAFTPGQTPSGSQQGQQSQQSQYNQTTGQRR